MTDEERDIMKILGGGFMDSRSKFGLRFLRTNNGGLSDKYTGTQAEKAKMRYDWLKADFAQKKEIREKSKSYKKVNFQRGKYKPFSMIWKNQGGRDDSRAYQAALNICRDCIKLGGEWVRLNKRSKRVEYFDLDEGWEKDFTEAWALYERRIQEPEATSTAGSPATSAAGSAVSAAGSASGSAVSAAVAAEGGGRGQGAEAKKTAIAKKKGRAKDGPGDDDSKKTLKSTLDIVFAEAQKIKKEYADTTLVAGQLKQRFDDCPDSAWVKADLSSLLGFEAKLQSSLTTFGSELLTSDSQTIRRRYKGRDQVLENDVNEFLHSIKLPLQKVAKQVKIINASIEAKLSVK